MTSTGRTLLFLLGAVPGTYAAVLAGQAAGVPAMTVVLPFALAAPATWLLWKRLAAGDRPGAVAWMLVWAAALAVFGPVAMALAPEASGAAVFRGVEYREEMLLWIATGEGAEGDIRQFLPVHLGRLALFVPLSLVTGGALGLVMGAAMMNFMDFFVASYAGLSSGIPAALAWFPWSLLRVAAFTILGVLTAEPLVRRVAGVVGSPAPGRGRLLGVAAALLVADVLLKAALAPTWGRFLAGHLD